MCLQLCMIIYIIIYLYLFINIIIYIHVGHMETFVQVFFIIRPQHTVPAEKYH